MKPLTAEEKKWVAILRRVQIDRREVEFYAIHGQKKGKPKNGK